MAREMIGKASTGALKGGTSVATMLLTKALAILWPAQLISPWSRSLYLTTFSISAFN
jgi:hypothetical protein